MVFSRFDCTERSTYYVEGAKVQADAEQPTKWTKPIS